MSPRVNLDDDIESMSEFWRLLPLVNGDREKALGKLVLGLRLALEFYGRAVPVPLTRIQEEGLADLVESGWFLPLDGGYQFADAEERFAWYRQKVEAGKKGGRPAGPTSANRPVSTANLPVPAVNPLVPVPAPALVQNNTLRPSGLLEIWNSNCGGLPKAKKLTPEREKKAKARLAEESDPTYWVSIAQSLAKDPFCRGENDRGWVAGIDYFLKPMTHIRHAEAMCHSQRPSTPAPRSEAEIKAELENRRKQALNGEANHVA